MDPSLKTIVIGGAGFRGCIANFTLNNELQSLIGGSKQLLEATVPPRVHLNGCDVEILRVAQPQTALDVGVIVAVAFFCHFTIHFCHIFPGFQNMWNKIFHEIRFKQVRDWWK